MDAHIKPIWDVIGIINGTNANETIIIGNHRDAWIVGGAADPNSGSAILIEITKAFGELLNTGWKPRRNMQVYSIPPLSSKLTLPQCLRLLGRRRVRPNRLN
jgi:hypothetical protein